jgi:RNA polymerase sigma factor (sigma-70 family)
VTVSISLASALATLPARQRTAVVLRFLADLSVAEIAEAMGCAEGTVKSTLHSALDRMRLRVEGEDYGR